MKCYCIYPFDRIIIINNRDYIFSQNNHDYQFNHYRAALKERLYSAFISVQVSPPRSFVHGNPDNFYLHKRVKGMHRLTLSVSSLHEHELTSCYAAAGTDEV